MEYLLSLVAFLLIPLVILYKDKDILKPIKKVIAVAVLISYAIGIPWDYIALERGWWSYGDKFLIGPKLFLIPLEDYIFMLVVPFSSVILFEYLRKKYAK